LFIYSVKNKNKNKYIEKNVLKNIVNVNYNKSHKVK